MWGGGLIIGGLFSFPRKGVYILEGLGGGGVIFRILWSYKRDIFLNLFSLIFLLALVRFEVHYIFLKQNNTNNKKFCLATNKLWAVSGSLIYLNSIGLMKSVFSQRSFMHTRQILEEFIQRL